MPLFLALVQQPGVHSRSCLASFHSIYLVCSRFIYLQAKLRAELHEAISADVLDAKLGGAGGVEITEMAEARPTPGQHVKSADRGGVCL
jgi:hypothetical protein